MIRAMKSSRGVTLTELMIATAILSVAVLGFVFSFQFIAKSLRLSRARTLAANLTQEKIETLKNLSYYQLLLSTSISNDNNFSPAIPYDNTNYPAETITIGGITFKRYSLVEMANVYNNVVTTTSVSFPDTGLKQLTVNVAWFENGSWKKQTLSNLFTNPNVNPLDAGIAGAVQWSSGSTVGPLAGAWVRVEQNTDWGAITNSAGVYSFRVYHGTYTIRASSAGYYDGTSGDVLATRGSTSYPATIKMTQIATATLTGYVWYNPTPVISQVVVSTTQLFTTYGSTDGSLSYNAQYIELFNPTTASWAMSNCGTPPCSGSAATHLNAWNTLPAYCDIELTYVSTYIPPHSYYLIANNTYMTVLGSTYSVNHLPIQHVRYPGSIDAYFDGNCNNVNGPANFTYINSRQAPSSGAGWNPSGNPKSLTFMQTGRTGCVWLTDSNGNVLDNAGWVKSACPPPPCGSNASGAVPLASCTGSYIDFSNISGGGGFQAGDQIVRVSSPMADVRYGQDLENFARVYNSTSNANDFMYSHPLPESLMGLVHPPFSVFQSTAVNFFSTSTLASDLHLYASTTIITGRILPQAYVGASDPYSGSTQTWNITISSYNMNLQISQFQLVGVTTTSSSNPWVVEIVSTTTWTGQVYWKEVSPIPSGQGSDTILGQNYVYGLAHSSNPAYLVPPYVSPAVPTPYFYSRLYYTLNLDSAPVDGFVEGIVTDPYNNPLSVQLNLGGRTTSSGANGRYFGLSSTGTVVIIANSNNIPPYIQQTGLVTVNSGQITTQNFALIQGGGVKGYVTSGTTPLPNIIVNALIGGNQYGTGSSDTTGVFYIKNLSSGTYTIEPTLDPSANSSPVFTTVTISSYTVDAGTFTITGAMSSISGNITYNGATLATGALIVASTNTIGSTPPAIAASTAPAMAAPIYCISSQADGTFTLPVRIANGYNLSAYIPIINGTSVSITTKTYSGLNVTGSGLTQNITVP